MVQHCQNCQPSRGHLNGKYRFYGLLSQVSQVSKVPQIRQRPHANCASHACPFRCCKLALRIHVFTGGAAGARDTRTRDTHTGAHGHTDARITQTNLTTIPTHQRYTNAPTRTTTETANSRSPDSGKTAVLVPEVSLFRQARGKQAARKVTHPSAALREAAVLRHGKRRSLPCTACAPPQESVSSNSKV
jgi:hypothetical protein